MNFPVFTVESQNRALKIIEPRVPPLNPSETIVLSVLEWSSYEAELARN